MSGSEQATIGLFGFMRRFLQPFDTRLMSSFLSVRALIGRTMTTRNARRRWRSFNLKGVSFREICAD